MFYLLILLLLAFVFVPLIKAFWSLFSQVRRVRKFMNDPTGYYRQAAQDAYGPATPKQPKRRGKKIARDEGEYIDFTEIKTTTQSSSSTSGTSFRQEEQITDIEWEDIK